VTHTERTAAAQALTRWGQTTALNRSGRLGELGGVQIIGKARSDYADGGREVVLEIDGIPCEPAHATLRHLAESPLALVRQLEYRLADLEDRRGRTIVRQQEAAQESVRAREALDGPFKHGDDLEALRKELAAVIEQMRQAGLERAADPPQEGPAAPTLDETAQTALMDRELPPAQPPRHGRRPDRRPLRDQPRQRPPVVVPPHVHNYPPPGGGVEL
jgi:hypothetical protein